MKEILNAHKAPPPVKLQISYKTSKRREKNPPVAIEKTKEFLIQYLE